MISPKTPAVPVPAASADPSLERLRLKLRYKVLYHVGHNCPDAEDLVQETLTRFVRAEQQGHIRNNAAEFGAFVNGVCRNVILEYRRRMRREPLADPGGSAAGRQCESGCGCFRIAPGHRSRFGGTGRAGPDDIATSLPGGQGQRRYLPGLEDDGCAISGGAVPGQRAFSPGLSAQMKVSK